MQGASRDAFGTLEDTGAKASPGSDAGQEANPEGASPKGAAPEAGYEGPICCTWPTEAGLCGGVTTTRLCPSPEGGYYSGLTCDEGACRLGTACRFNAGVLYFDAAGECHGTVTACSYSCQ